MPRVVDRGARRREVVTAAMEELAELGLEDFSLRNVGRRLGGSVTLVTHYFSSRDELFTEMRAQLIADSHTVVEELAACTDPWVRLEQMLNYFLLDTEAAVVAERARIALSANTLSSRDATTARALSELEPAMRTVVEAGLRDVVPHAGMDQWIGFVRLWSSGLALSYVEHPDLWTPERQRTSARMLAAAIRAGGDI